MVLRDLEERVTSILITSKPFEDIFFVSLEPLGLMSSNRDSLAAGILESTSLYAHRN